jgi:hypothetical protein
VDVCESFQEASISLKKNPKSYGLILISGLVISKNDLDNSLAVLFQSIPLHLFISVIAYEIDLDDVELVEKLLTLGVSDILLEPYSLQSIKVQFFNLK